MSHLTENPGGDAAKGLPIDHELEAFFDVCGPVSDHPRLVAQGTVDRITVAGIDLGNGPKTTRYADGRRRDEIVSA